MLDEKMTDLKNLVDKTSVETPYYNVQFVQRIS